MGFISPSLSEPHPQMKHTVTACWGHNQLPHFLGDSLKSLERAFFQFEVFENDNPLYITAKYLISAHVRGQWRAIRKPLEWRRPWEGWWDLIFLVKKKKNSQFALQEKTCALNWSNCTDELKGPFCDELSSHKEDLTCLSYLLCAEPCGVDSHMVLKHCWEVDTVPFILLLRWWELPQMVSLESARELGRGDTKETRAGWGLWIQCHDIFITAEIAAGRKWGKKSSRNRLALKQVLSYQLGVEWC